MTLKVGIVVGEISGDRLAAGLIRALRRYYPTLTFEGVLGPALLKEGGTGLYPMDRLAVMGLVEPLARIPELLCARRRLIQHFIQNPPDVFIGVDSPDFTLRMERVLKEKGIPTVHYVSPTVWAWRRGRIHTIKKSVDLMLTLFPFEAQFYEQHAVPVQCVGHPLADQIPLEEDTAAAKMRLGVDLNAPLVALLPGSRTGELNYLAQVFLEAARYCYERDPNVHFIVPVVSGSHAAQMVALVHKVAPALPIKIVVGNTPTAMAAADVALVTSGTATLELMLHKKPMVVAYRLHPISYQILKRLVKVKHIALPNLLANKTLVPEYIQEQATAEQLGSAVLELLSLAREGKQIALTQHFSEIHRSLRRNASQTAADAVKQLLSNGLFPPL